MSEPKMPHPDHENHLCYLENVGYVQQYPDAYKALVKKGKFMCRVCGRVAADMGHLCVPDKL